MPSNPVRVEADTFDAQARALLDEIRERGAHYFHERANPQTGLICDRAQAKGGALVDQYATASIAATGFGMSALCVAAKHGLIAQGECADRLHRTLDFLVNAAPTEHGFFPRYLNVHTGKRNGGSEFSSIDTTLLLFGALNARTFLNTASADAAVKTLFERVDWQWMQNTAAVADGKPAMLSMGWLPDSGFLPARWTSFSECLLMYLVAIASPTHGLPASIWDHIERSLYDYGGLRFISSYGALFIHQYPNIWLDLRGVRDQYGDPWANATRATQAHKIWCALQHGRFPWIDERLWGFSASDTPGGVYQAWGAPPEVGVWDGTIAPHAAGGSLPFLPDECVAVLATIRDHYPSAFDRYGFADALNPGSDNGRGWIDTDVIGIDIGLTMLMAENLVTGSVRQAGMGCPEIQQAMQMVKLHKVEGDKAASGL